MLRIDLISAVPDLLGNPLSHSIVKIAREKGLLDVHIHNLRDYSADRHRKIDDYPYGGGAGMVITPQPVFTCIEKLTSERSYDEIIFMSPDGAAFNQKQANNMSLRRNIIILCGHYKGIDQRIRDVLITREYSIGDVVLSGGELPALMVVDTVARLLPGVLGDAESALTDSFQDDLLDSPVYTRPADFRGIKVPEVLTSGDHEKVKAWRKQQAVDKTRQLRPDIYNEYLKKNDE
ncbi:MAG: tRNA (guanosine(37)-N1)-methyltransferase TrmD [Rhodothermaceae bacterium]|nr:tRNA (guanosine(37)-N1)-methyltransferase TrmD [Rhodothermaceae bacterium]